MDIYKERRYIAMINKSKTKRMNDWLMNQWMVYEMKEWMTNESINGLQDERMNNSWINE